jgi:periplasmic protein TonB
MTHYTILKNLSIIFCFNFFAISNTQASDLQISKLHLPDSFVYNQVDEQASYPGGIPELKKFIANTIILPELVKAGTVSGKVVLRLTISGKGEISNIVVQKGIENCKECEEEAIRVVKAMPNWNPAKVGNSTVRSTAVVPINFTSTPK